MTIEGEDLSLLESLVSEQVAEALLREYSNANPGRILESSEFSKILRWAEETEISSALLRGVVDGDIMPSVNEKGEVVFSVTDKGIKRGKEAVMSIKLPNSDVIN